MSAEHDYTSPAQLRDENLERKLDTSQALRGESASPTPRLALWISIIAGLMLIVGLSFALAGEFDADEPAGTTPGDAPVSALASDVPALR